MPCPRTDRPLSRLSCLGLVVAALLAATAPSPARADGETLATIRARDAVRCGVIDTDMSARRGGDGRWHGFEAEFCRALAAAVLGTADLAEIVPLDVQTRFPALIAGDIDVLFANTTWTYARDVGQPVNFAGILFYDGQGFLGRRQQGVRTLADVKDATVCVSKETTTEANLVDYIRIHNLSWQPLRLNSDEGRNDAFINGRCNLLTNDRGALVAFRITTGLPDLFLFPEVISKEPLAASVRTGDETWLKTVRWLINAVIGAEELGVGKANVERLAAAGGDAAVAPFLGRQKGLGAPLDLADDWVFQVLRQVGNYGEIFERTVGEGSPLKMDRGPNRPWTDGGLLYAPPLR